MTLALKIGDAIYSHADYDKGKVTRRSNRLSPHARVDLMLSNIFGAKRSKTHLYKRLPQREVLWSREIRSESSGNGFYYRIRKVPIQSCSDGAIKGHYYWMTVSTRRYRPNGDFYYLGNDDHRLVGVSLDGALIHRADLRFVLPDDEAPLGFEDLYADLYPYDPGD